MKRIDIEEIMRADVSQLQDWLSNMRFKITMTNWNAMSEEERKNTLVPLNGDDLSRDEFQSQVTSWAAQPRTLHIPITRLCELVAENKIGSYRELGEFDEFWFSEQIYFLIMQYLEKLNLYWRQNSFALLPEAEMQTITDDVRKLEGLAKLLHNEAKYQMEVRLINEESRQRLMKNEQFRKTVESSTHQSPWDMDLLDEVLFHKKESETTIALPERERYQSPVTAQALTQDYDLLKNRTKRW